jgi:hypothetical protein
MSSAALHLAASGTGRFPRNFCSLDRRTSRTLSLNPKRAGNLHNPLCHPERPVLMCYIPNEFR